MSYRLEELGPLEFERMVQALLLRLYGPTVTVFGTGRDDGRDGTYTGRAVPADDAGGENPAWDGYHVFQSKFHERPTSPAANRKWLEGQVKSELKAWSEQATEGEGLQRKGERPHYYVVVTNTTLSGQIDGGRDSVEKIIWAHAANRDNAFPLKKCAIWDRSKVERLLDAYPDVRQTFNGLLTVGDVLAALQAGHMTTATLDQTVPILEEHARTELGANRGVALSEAGDLNNQRLALADVAVDLPAHLADDDDSSSTVDVLAHLITAGNRNLRPEVRGEKHSPHVLLLGGPGQGKTTLGRILVQTYRAELLADRTSLSTDVRDVVTATRQRATDLSLPPVVVRRWPFRVDLAKYGEAVAGGANLPLIRHIADEINDLTGDSFSPKDVRTWLGAWPWLLVLDGYDEVAAPLARDNVAKAVRALLEVARTEDADLMVVATTRPQGYGDELPQDLRHVELQDLDPQAAVRYATRLTHLRMGNDPTKVEVLQSIVAAADNDVTSRLMRTPLQITILSLLLEKRRKPPQDRAALFASYYDVIYEREVQKKNHLAKALETHRLDIDSIHNAVGLTLQTRSESHGDADALMPAEEFEKVIKQRLVEQEHEGRDLERLVDSLTKAARDRLVLLAAKGKDYVGFDLRSLQEYMAARALTAASDDVVIRNLEVLAGAAHWSNTWLLAVGIVYRDKAHLFDRVLQIMDSVDADDDPLSVIAPLGPRLAIDVLDDGMATASPKNVRLLIRHALRTLNGVGVSGAGRLGGVLADLPDLNESTRREIFQALEGALRGTPSSREMARHVLNALAGPGQTGPLAAKARQIRPAQPEPLPSEKAKAVPLADLLPMSWAPDTLAYRFREDLRRIFVMADSSTLISSYPSQPASAAEVLADPDCLLQVVTGIEEIAEDNWAAKSAIASLLVRARAYLPVSSSLTAAATV